MDRAPLRRRCARRHRALERHPHHRRADADRCRSADARTRSASTSMPSTGPRSSADAHPVRLPPCCLPPFRSPPARRPGSRRRSATTTRRSQAVLQPDPPKPVQIVELPKPLPLPGQLKPLPGPKAPPEPADPHARVEEANGAARVQPTRAGYINAMQVYPFSEARSIRSMQRPAQITDIALEPGEQLVGSGPVAAGDTVRWIIGDTESGTGAGQAHPHPRQADARGPRHQPRHQHRPAHLSSRAALRPRRPTWRRSPGPMRRTSSSPCAGRMLPPRPRTRRRHRRRHQCAELPLPDRRRHSALASAARLRRRPPGVHRVPDRHRPGRDAAALGDRRRRRRPNSSTTASRAIT